MAACVPLDAFSYLNRHRGLMVQDAVVKAGDNCARRRAIGPQGAGGKAARGAPAGVPGRPSYR